MKLVFNMESSALVHFIKQLHIYTVSVLQMIQTQLVIVRLCVRDNKK